MKLFKREWSGTAKHVVVGLLTLIAAISTALISPTQASLPDQPAPFNQPDFYPLSQTLPADYRSVADWLGRLILPDSAARSADSEDWVEFEVYHAPETAQFVPGQRVKLTWQADPLPQVAKLTRTVQFTPEVQASLAKGNVHPERLNGQRVGPLQSLAGARLQDDVIVSLTDVAIEPAPSADARPVLRIRQPPLQQTGRDYTLVKILENLPDSTVPSDCLGAKPCPSELFRVQHYNLQTRQFDGRSETVRIPQQPRSRIGLFNSTPRDLVQSSAGGEGWYLFGAQDATGLFTVQALKPRSLFQVQPQQVQRGNQASWRYIQTGNWADTPQRKGTIQTTSLDTHGRQTDAVPWQEGDRFLLMHLFGGRGGLQGEAPLLGTVTGHFSYGTGKVVREPLADELQFDLTYEQVYASNLEGIISGSQSWSTFMGNLQRGWLATRPVSDVLIRLDSITRDYQFGDVTLSPLQTLLDELHTITARYRIGDGTGGAMVTPATSCVQDSNQALFIAIQRLQTQVVNSPAIQAWQQSHPADPDALRFQELVDLGEDLERTLTPLGIVREDWQKNAQVLTGTGQFTPMAPSGLNNLLAGLTSWRTALPRGTQDDLSLVFLRHGAQLWFFRTNQVGGLNPDIVPIAPTRQFGTWMLGGVPLVSLLVDRLIGSIRLLTGQDWRAIAIALLAYGAMALPLGLQTGFLKWPGQSNQTRLPFTAMTGIGLALRLLILPALVEELLFRVLLLPYPGTYLSPASWWMWAALSLVLFVVYHPLNAKTLYRSGDPTFFDPRFLVLTTLLGLTCTLAYSLTSSWFVISIIHWIVVVVWILGLGGISRLHAQPTHPEL